MHFIPINYSDPGFALADTADLQLFILINESFFSYAVRHPGTRRLVRVSTNKPVEELFDAEVSAALLNAPYLDITVAIQTSSFCFIPDAVFNTENLLDFAAFLSVKEADLILTDLVKNGNNQVIYTFPEQLIRKIEAHFPSAKMLFAPKSWISKVFQSPVSGQQLYLFLSENQLQILLPDQQNIRFYNQFTCANLDDLVYYTALVAAQLKLNPEETSLVLSGRVEANGEQMLHLKQYFKEVTLFTSPDYQQRSSLPEHHVVDFLGLS